MVGDLFCYYWVYFFEYFVVFLMEQFVVVVYIGWVGVVEEVEVVVDVVGEVCLQVGVQYFLLIGIGGVFGLFQNYCGVYVIENKVVVVVFLGQVFGINFWIDYQYVVCGIVVNGVDVGLDIEGGVGVGYVYVVILVVCYVQSLLYFYCYGWISMLYVGIGYQYCVQIVWLQIGIVECLVGGQYGDFCLY